MPDYYSLCCICFCPFSVVASAQGQPKLVLLVCGKKFAKISHDNTFVNPINAMTVEDLQTERRWRE